MKRKNSMLINLARYDRGSLPGEAEITDEGFIRAKAIVTRCGVFLYKNPDGTIRKELRHPDEVLKIDTMESLKMIPIVNGHPPEKLVSAENAKRLSVGYTGETVEQNMPYILSNLVITDENMVKEIKSKKKNELSLGYTVDIVEEPGIYYGEPYDCIQTNIRYNHLAVVDEARAGPEARIALDAQDAIEIFKQEAKMVKKRKVKIDTEEYLLDDDVGGKVEKLMEEMSHHQKRVSELEDMIAKAHAERDHMKEKMEGEEEDSLRDKDFHNPEKEHEPFNVNREGSEMEKDEIGSNGKEEMDPVDLYGMQSHVRDFEPPTHMRNHVVNEPKNKKYPNDLPHVSKVDGANMQKVIKERVKLEKLAEKYLDNTTISRIDSLTNTEIKKRIILSVNKKADLDGKSDIYISARFDSVLEELPQNKVVATPSTYNNDSLNKEKDRANANEARSRMISRQREMYKTRSN